MFTSLLISCQTKKSKGAIYENPKWERKFLRGVTLNARGPITKNRGGPYTKFQTGNENY